MRQQDENTTPREPTLAERRARERAERRGREEEEQRVADEAAGRKKRKRILVGAGVTAGVVALVAVGYAVAQPEEEIEAHCVDDSGVVVDDSNCAVPARTPPLLRRGRRSPSSRFSSAAAGGSTTTTTAAPARSASACSGGTTTVPKDGTPVRTSSGSSTVTRGGLGVSKSTSGGAWAAAARGGSKSGGSGRGRAPAAARAAAAERMERRTGAPRAGWHKTVTEQGLVYDAPGRGQGGADRPYWDESVHYVFAMDEILALEADVELLHSMCLEAVDHVVHDRAVPRLRAARVELGGRRGVVEAARPAHLRPLRPALRRPRAVQDAGVQRGHPDHAARGVDPAVVLAQGPSTRTTTSGTPCTRSSSSAGARSPRSCRPASCTSPGRRATRRARTT